MERLGRPRPWPRRERERETDEREKAEGKACGRWKEWKKRFFSLSFPPSLPLLSCEHERAQPWLRTPPACLRRRFPLLLLRLEKSTGWGVGEEGVRDGGCRTRRPLLPGSRINVRSPVRPSPPDSSAEMWQQTQVDRTHSTGCDRRGWRWRGGQSSPSTRGGVQPAAHRRRQPRNPTTSTCGSSSARWPTSPCWVTVSSGHTPLRSPPRRPLEPGPTARGAVVAVQGRRRQWRGAEPPGVPEPAPCRYPSPRCSPSQSTHSSQCHGVARKGHPTAATRGPSPPGLPGKNRRGTGGVVGARTVWSPHPRSGMVVTGRRRRCLEAAPGRGRPSWTRRWSSPCWATWSRCCTPSPAHVSLKSGSLVAALSKDDKLQRSFVLGLFFTANAVAH